MSKSLLSFCLVSLLAISTPAAGAPTYSVTGRIPVGGAGGWDYVTFDGPSHRLFIARGTHVQVLDLISRKIVGDIPDTAGVHGVALATPEGRGFASDGKANAVTIFDLKTLKVLGQVPVGKKPDAIMYEPTTKRVFTMNGDSADSTAIDARSGKVVGTVSLGGSPEFAGHDGKGHVYVNLEDKSEVVEFDARRLTLLGHWSLAPGEEPTGLAVDAPHHRLFIGCHNQKMVVFDTLAHRVTTTLPIGSGVDATAYDPTLQIALASNGDGTLTVVGTRPYAVLQNVRTMKGARTMALDPVTHRVYLVTATPTSIPTLEERKHGKRPQYAPDSFTVLVVTRTK